MIWGPHSPSINGTPIAANRGGRTPLFCRNGLKKILIKVEWTELNPGPNKSSIEKVEGENQLNRTKGKENAHLGSDHLGKFLNDIFFSLVFKALEQTHEHDRLLLKINFALYICKLRFDPCFPCKSPCVVRSVWYWIRMIDLFDWLKNRLLP